MVRALVVRMVWVNIGNQHRFCAPASGRALLAPRRSEPVTMTAKRDTSRQRRVNQNRSAREALVARRQAAAQKTGPEPEAPAKRGRLSRGQAEPVVPARSRGTRATAAPRSASTAAAVPDDVEPASGIVARAQQIVGGRQMLIGFALIVAGSPLAAFVPMFREKGGKHNESLVTILGWRAIPVLLVPIAIAAIPLLTLNYRRRRLAWNVAAFLLGMWVLLTNLLLFYGLGLAAVDLGSHQEFACGGSARQTRRPLRSTTAPPRR